MNEINTETKCLKCGTTLQEGQKFCPACGAKLATLGSTLPKKKLITIGAIAAALVAVIVVIVIVVGVASSPINKFTKAVNDGAYEVAVALYNENKTEQKFSEKSQKFLSEFLTDIKSDFVNDKIDYQTANDRLNGVAGVVSTNDANAFLSKLNSSKTAFADAEKATQSGDYYTALTQYSKVIADDSGNYAKVNKAIESVKAELIEQAIADANQKVGVGDYEDAISALNKVQSNGYADDSITALLEQTKAGYSESIRQEAIKSADALAARNDFTGAFDILKAVPSEHGNNEITAKMSEMKPKATQNVFDTASAKFNSGDFIGAYDYLNGVSSDLLSTEVRALKASSRSKCIADATQQADAYAQSGDYAEAVSLLDTAIRKFSIVDATIRDKRDQYNQYNLKKLEGEQLITVEKTQVWPTYNYSGIVDAFVVIKNGSDKVVKQYVVAMIMLDSDGFLLHNSYDYNYYGYTNVYVGKRDSVNIQPGETYGSTSYNGPTSFYWMIDGGGICKKILACVVSAEFDDGTTWNNSYYDAWVEMYAGKTINWLTV
jgi:uncharacterized OB-fold protein/thioredoxin-like negative regulator of GroEL